MTLPREVDAPQLNSGRRPRRPGRKIDLKRIEEMLLFCARMVDELGPVAQPWLDRLESEYHLAKNKGKEEQRIRDLLRS